MNERTKTIFLIFLISVTPSLSDMVQVNEYVEGAWIYVALWYVVLLAFLFKLWEGG